MKKHFWLIILLISFIKPVLAQNNYCDDIIRDTDVVKKATILKCPDLNITVKGIITNAPQLWINFNVKQLSEFISEDGGLFIRFNDGKTLRYFGQRVARKYMNNHDGYYYQTDMLVKPTDLAWFKTKKISRYQIAGIDVPVTDDLAVAIQAYIVCITGNFNAQ